MPENTPYTTTQALSDVRAHMLTCHAGTLATLCRAELPLAGYPVPSVVPFVLDDDFRPVILIADIAEHTHNALADPRASLFIRAGDDRGNVQTQWRIGMIGDLLPVPEAEVAEMAARYGRYFPESRDYHRTHGFRYFRLHTKKYRVIMGFGAIRWLKAEAVYEKSAFAEAAKAPVLAHMNADHPEAMRGYLRQRGLNVDVADRVEMIDVHQYGFTLRHAGARHFIPFAQPAHTAQAVREQLVALARPSV